MSVLATIDAESVVSFISWFGGNHSLASFPFFLLRPHHYPTVPCVVAKD